MKASFSWPPIDPSTSTRPCTVASPLCSPSAPLLKFALGAWIAQPSQGSVSMDVDLNQWHGSCAIKLLVTWLAETHLPGDGSHFDMRRMSERVYRRMGWACTVLSILQEFPLCSLQTYFSWIFSLRKTRFGCWKYVWDDETVVLIL